MQLLRIMLVVALVSTAAVPLRRVLDYDTLLTPWPRWRWMHRWIVEGERREIDYAFVGSSKTQTDIMPVILQELIPGTRAVNVGHFKFGHDVDYYIAEALLRLHDVDTLVVEIPEKWETEPHEQVPYLVSARELPGEIALTLREVTLGSWLRCDDDAKAAVSRITWFTAVSWLSLPARALDDGSRRLRGVAPEPIADGEKLDRKLGYAGLDDQLPAFVEGARENPMPRFRPPEEFSVHRADRPRPGSRDDWYLERLAALARRHGTALAFAYMPSWQLPLPTLETVDYYGQLGTVLIPDVTQLNRIEQYRDNRHLTTIGARRYTRELGRLLVEGPEASPYGPFYETLRARRAASSTGDGG